MKQEEIIIPKMSREEIEDYRMRLGRYIIVMTHLKRMMDQGELSMEDYDSLERVYLAKYRIDEKSLERLDLKSISERDSWRKKWK